MTQKFKLNTILERVIT